eukprot:TRINITY_DN2649_c0_g1_i1.p1 TRINITY_DN2649_c0_g1~~TRINITY_DN2649_c0_g1_i1.p1  ORF type:complete len:493 (+),score=103.24 TRINITY_DN2649_c0_g1_i1:95-1480(+)
MDDPGEIISNFVAITGADPDFAVTFLENHGWDLETAVALYLEGGGARLQEQQSFKPSGGDDIPNLRDYEEEEVRAPIMPKAEVLVDQMPRGRQFRAPRSGFSPQHPPNAFDMFRDFQEETKFFEQQKKVQEQRSKSGGESKQTIEEDASLKKAKRLADLFRPPFDLMHQGTFDEVRSFARANEKWVLVNVQTPSEFDCQRLNRDTWSDSAVKSVVKENFVLWQVERIGDEGDRYARFYPCEILPHIAIIDPRTGERVQIWETFIEPKTLVRYLTDFLAHNSLQTFPSPRAKDQEKAPEAKRRTIGEEAEEEELMRALEMSRQEQEKTRPLTATTTQDTTPPPVPEQTRQPAPVPVPVPAPVPAAPVPEPTPVLPAYNPPGPDEESTPIQIRLPGSGGILKQNFRPADTLANVYQYVAAAWPGGAPRFTLNSTFPRKIFEPSDATLRDSGLLRAVLIAEPKD